jgi:predicted RNase H-like HicB family nuclease
MDNKYRVKIDWSEEDQAYIARVPELEGVVTHGETLIEAAKNAEEAIGLHLETLAERGEQAPKPIAEMNLSGNMSLRMGTELHGTAVINAGKANKSLNEYIVDLIKRDDQAQELVADFHEVARSMMPELEEVVAEKLTAYVNGGHKIEMPAPVYSKVLPKVHSAVLKAVKKPLATKRRLK